MGRRGSQDDQRAVLAAADPGTTAQSGAVTAGRAVGRSVVVGYVEIVLTTIAVAVVVVFRAIAVWPNLLESVCLIVPPTEFTTPVVRDFC